MSTRLDQELKAAFETSSEFVEARPGLADRVRAGVRRRRRRALAAMAAASAVLLAIAGTTYGALSQHRDATAVPQRPRTAPRILATVDYQVTQLAVSGRYLYVLAGQNSLLTAYDRATGKLIRQVTLPSLASAVAVGPGGLVWIGFSPDQGSGPTGIWLLTPDLRRHSADPGLLAPTILPTGRTSAWVPTRDGLLRVGIPAPGQPGRASQELEPGSTLGPVRGAVPGISSGQLGGRVAVLVSTGSGDDSRLVIAGSPNLRFGGTPQTHISAIASTGTALWTTTFTQRHGESSLGGPLVRLNTRLSPATPESVQSSPILTRAESVWSAGDTIWVATGVQGHSLVCLTTSGTNGRITTLPVSGEVVALAATARTVYVNALQPPGSDAPSHITGYPVPAACRN
ncbi:MAG: hypothetical protein ACRDRJ_03835 [Streptosporangiaceae bacterium]